jgi:hypothetical protein
MPSQRLAEGYHSGLSSCILQLALIPALRLVVAHRASRLEVLSGRAGSWPAAQAGRAP